MRSDARTTWTRSLLDGLCSLESRSQRRDLAEIHGVNLCSNDYLGLAQNPALHEAVAQAVQNAERVAGTGSRLLSGHTQAWESLEDEFASFIGTESALYFTTGYAANLGLLSSLIGKEDVVFSDELNHASLIDGMRLSGARKIIYPHLNLQALESALEQEAGAPWRKVIITESVFSMDGDVAPLREIAELAGKYGAGLIIDEAHATGVHGPIGRGIAAAAGIVPEALAIVHTCGKALASAGAFVCGPRVLREHLINNARTFIFSTALPPYFAEQIRAAMRLSFDMNEERHHLLSLAAAFRNSLHADGWDTSASASQIVPIITGSNTSALQAAEALQQEGFAVRAIRPPTVPEGRARLRLSLTAKLQREDLDRLVQTLSAWRGSHQLAGVTRQL